VAVAIIHVPIRHLISMLMMNYDQMDENNSWVVIFGSLEDFTNDDAWGCRAHHFTGPTVGSLKSIH
jgi:hypothetical protein